MPPKAAASTTSTRRRADNKAPGTRESLSPEEEKVLAERQVEVLKQQLNLALARAADAEVIAQRREADLTEMQRELRLEQQRTADIVADMTRQHKAVRHAADQERREAAVKLQEMQALLKQTQDDYEQAIKALDMKLTLKNEELRQCQQRLDRMGEEFTKLLDTTLQKVSRSLMQDPSQSPSTLMNELVQHNLPNLSISDLSKSSRAGNMGSKDGLDAKL